MLGFSLLKNTNAYKIFLGDKKNATLSHAYLIVCEDENYLENYLKAFAKTLTCEEEVPCNNCRTCKLIDGKIHTDVIFYPQGKKIVVSDVDDIIEKSFLKPLESDKKIFVLTDVASMNQQSQNKLLKTLEEPPKNTYILMGTTSVYPLLSTVLSRCKRLDILPFSENELLNETKNHFSDQEKLETAIRLSGGKLGEVISRYESGKGSEAENLAIEILLNLKTSSDAVRYAPMVEKGMLEDFISSLFKITEYALNKSINGDYIVPKHLETAVNNILKDTSVGALVFISDKIRIAEKAVFYNGNLNAVVDGLLFGIVEGKYKYGKNSRG